MNAALILMADHELATSTMAVHVAASVHSDSYDALMAGLATLAGPLHGGASQQAYELLVVAERDGVARAERRAARTGRLPGFGHAVYKNGDARFDALLTLAKPLLSEERRAILEEVIMLAAAHDVPLANCDLALAALSWGTGMPPDTGRTIFAVVCRGVDGPLHEGADGATPALPCPGGLQRLTLPAPRQDDGQADQPGPMTMAEGWPPTWIGWPTMPVAKVTGTSVPICCVTHAWCRPRSNATPCATSGSATGAPTVRPTTATGTTAAPPQT